MQLEQLFKEDKPLPQANAKQIDVKLSVFEGPLDVLCHLIQKNEIDIYDIPIAVLTDQYLEYIKDIDFDLMESMSSFIVMGATLLEIKSRMLLPESIVDGESPEDMKNALIARLVEYKAFKEISDKIVSLAGYDDLMIFKSPDKKAFDDIVRNSSPSVADCLDGITLRLMLDTYKDLQKRRRAAFNEAYTDFGNVAKDLITVNEKVNSIIDMLSGKKSVSFHRMLGESMTKEEKIVTFLAVLELIKMKLVNIRQDKIFGDIVLKKAVG